MLACLGANLIAAAPRRASDGGFRFMLGVWHQTRKQHGHWMITAYADPPYPGHADLYKGHADYAGEVDHDALLTRLCDEFPDGWALHTASTTLQQVLALCPTDVRIGAWVKPFGMFKPGVNPGYVWEPVIFRGGRRRTDRQEETVRDWCSVPITLERGLVGAKPEGVCFWVFALLGLRAGDELVDLFPGTGGVTLAWERWQHQLFAA